MSAAATVFAQSFLHGNRAKLRPGDLLTTGHVSNFRAAPPLAWVCFTATLDTAIWGAELAAGEAAARIDPVEPTGTYEDDPNVTNKRFAGNPTLSYRSREPVRVLAEIIGWQGHAPETITQRKTDLARLRTEGRDVNRRPVRACP